MQRDRLARLEKMVYAQHEKLDRLEDLVYRVMHRDRVTANGEDLRDEQISPPNRSGMDATLSTPGDEMIDTTFFTEKKLEHRL